MKLKKGTPPNFNQIQQVLKPDEYTVYAYGDTIYCEEPENLPPDVIVHEKVHQRQQELYTSPDLWWQKYLQDPQFRLEQELEAYAEQYLWVKWNGPTNLADEALYEFGRELASEQYQLNLTPQEASSKIRNKAKNMV